MTNLRLILLGMTFLAAIPSWSEAKLLRAGTCGGCHVKNFNGWHASGHAKSVSGKEFKRSLERHLLKEERDDGSFCFRCHAPVILMTGEAFKATKEILRGKASREGVTCVVCHSVESVKGGIAIYAPGDISAYHKVKNLKFIDREALCTTCHGSYNFDTNDEPSEAGKKGFFTSITLKFEKLIGKGSKKETDHRFKGTVSEHDETGGCPGLTDPEGVEEYDH